ncbi:MAG: serine/threonine protein kinase [Sandaracinus sp.]|nr:serine/threonine protein kinase [Sandaracinus sp.]
MTAAPKVCPLCGLRYDAAATFCQKDGAVLTSGGGDDPFLGRIVLGQFRIDEPIGSGGMGSVYRAHQTTLGRDVAIKILHPELAKNSDAVRRFHREARVATSLEHPNLVRVFLFGELPEDGNLYLVMEHLAGRSLVDVIDQDGVMPVPRAMHVITQICDAIGVAHAQGIVHRDVKPENVMLVDRLGDTDFVKVLDFGIARMLWDQQTALTQSGVIFGTARYISPEGASGEATDARSDVYSIGILAYQLLAGVTPFEAGSPVAMLMKHIHDPAPALRSRGEGRRVPQVVADVVMRALAKNPDMRYDDAGQLARALRDAAELAAIPVAGIAVGRGSYRPSAPTAPPPNAPRPHAPPSGALASSALAPAAPRPRREPTPTAPVRRENTDAIVANIPGLPGRPRWPTMLLAFAIGAAAVVGGVMAWRAAGTPEVATPTELERAEAALAAGRFDGTPGDDVLSLTAVLASNGAAEDARRLRDEATRRLRDAARGTLDRARARDAWTRLLAFVPDDVEALERRAALDAPPDPEPGLHLPSDVRAGDEVTLEVVLGEGTYAEDARFELYRGNRRVARLDAVRAGVERRWLGTTTIRTSGSYEVRFTVGGLEEPVIAPLEVSRASNAPRRSTETPRTTVLRTTPQTTAMEELPPPVVVEDDGIDWTIPANMGGATMTSTPPPDPGAPPPWTG